MFTTPCFIRKKTKKIISELEALGYGEYAFIGDCIAVNQTKFITVFFEISELDGIDCGTNKQLFLAIAALRNDTDKNQWFKMNNDSMLNTDINIYPSFKEWFCPDTDKIYEELADQYHKASIKELIEHFK